MQNSVPRYLMILRRAVDPKCIAHVTHDLNCANSELCRLPAAYVHTTATRFGRGRRRNLDDRFTFADDDSDPQWKSPDNDMEDMQQFVTLDPKQRQNKYAEELEAKKRHKSFVKFKTIERKYFRPPPSASILTWRAKEQIRYMYAEDPDQSGIHSILDIFPLTEQELQKLLKSKAIMKNKEDIERHDQRVYHKWSLILENYHCLEGPLKQTLDRLIESDQIEKIVNAGGVEGIPEVGTPTLLELAHQVPEKPGPFANLLLTHGKTGQQPLHLLQSNKLPPADADIEPNSNPSQQHIRTLHNILKYVKRNEMINRQQTRSYDLPMTAESVPMSDFNHPVSDNDRVLSPEFYQQGKSLVDENGELVFKIP